MNIKLNSEKLKDILISFYEMNGIRIVIFDKDYNEIMAHPETNCRFCQSVRKKTELNALCLKSDKEACVKSLKQNEIYIYKCHAGLIEAVMPMIYENQIMGYIMFGQITDLKDKLELSELVIEFNRRHNLTCDTSGINYKSRKQIIAAAKILEICTEYIILKEMVALNNDKIVAAAKQYIKDNLAENICIEDLCRYCGCGRTKLYKMFTAECGVGIAQYITQKRMSAAKKLLRSTDLSISEISTACGFCDYNYFSRVFKKKYGVSPKAERNKRFY